MSEDELVKRFPRLREWEHKTERPTFKQLEEYARATRAPFGYFFLAEPPIEQVPIPPLSSVSADNRRLSRLCGVLRQDRHAWYPQIVHWDVIEEYPAGRRKPHLSLERIGRTAAIVRIPTPASRWRQPPGIWVIRVNPTKFSQKCIAGDAVVG